MTPTSAAPSLGRVLAASVAAAAFALFAGLGIDTAAAHAPGLARPANAAYDAPGQGPLNSCVPSALRRNAVSFAAADGVRLSGLLLGSGTKGVTLAHESGWDICSWLPFAQVLAKNGYRVILWDFRNVGASGKSSAEGTYHLDRDVLAAAQELNRHGVTSIVAGGASAGGTATLAAASRIPNLKGVLIISSPRRFGVPASEAMDGVAGVKRVPQPAFFAAATENQTFEEEVRGLYDASPSKDKHLELVPGETHGADLLEGAAGAPLSAKALAFVEHAFGGAPPATSASARPQTNAATADGDSGGQSPWPTITGLAVAGAIGCAVALSGRRRGRARRLPQPGRHA